MTDSNLVSEATLSAVIAHREKQAEGDGPLTEVARREPVLAAYITDRLLVTCGALTLSGAPAEVVRAVHAAFTEVVATSVQAIWQGHDDLWEGVDVCQAADSLKGTAAAGGSRRGTPNGRTPSTAGVPTNSAGDQQDGGDYGIDGA